MRRVSHHRTLRRSRQLRFRAAAPLHTYLPDNRDNFVAETSIGTIKTSSSMSIRRASVTIQAVQTDRIFSGVMLLSKSARTLRRWGRYAPVESGQWSPKMNDKAKPVQIGRILMDHGVLTEAQVEQILREQSAHARPFGLIAEDMFGISADAVEKAWIDQYISYGTEIDLDKQRVDLQVLRMLNRRQAWQFRLLPIRRESRQLVAATSREHLKRAVNFAWRRFDDPVYFLIARRPQLEEFLMEHYPWPAALDLPLAS
ncbi:MAG: hypothetical protein GC162_18605 [Planctomycetes bacterium]|nr:hypothetical protein [Planctomycetota bacterium]